MLESYTIGPRIGEGGMGVVHRGRAPDGRDVAIKLLLRATPGAVARFEREARLLAELGEGEGFVPLLESGVSPAHGPYVVMPFLPGGTLRERLREPLALDEALALAHAIASAVGAAHARGIVHRDLKPENILFTGDGRPLVSDLGLGKRYDDEGSSLSRTGEARGTVGYMAMELMQDAKRAGPPADVFALGAILYELLAGAPAFAGDSALAVQAAAASGRPSRPLRELREDVPAWVERVIERSVALEPAERYPNGFAFAQALREERDQRSSSRGLVVSLVVVVALVAVALGVGLAPRNPATAPSTTGAVVELRKAPPATTTFPAWFQALPADARPPLPKGLEPGPVPGEYRWSRDGSRLVWIAPGTFVFGVSYEEDRNAEDAPPVEVSLSGYFVGKYEVTREQYLAFAADSHYRTEAERSGKGARDQLIPGERPGSIGHYLVDVPGASFRLPRDEPPAPNEPATQVSWNDAREYARWAGLDLPTDAEWERAAGWDPRAKVRLRFACRTLAGEPPRLVGPPSANLRDVSWRRRFPDDIPDQPLFLEGYDDGFPRVAPVGSFEEGVSPSGAFDMTGNVREWVLDYRHSGGHKRLRSGERRSVDPCFDEPEAPGLHICRGGCFLDAEYDATIGYRWTRNLNRGTDATGFRVVLRPAAERRHLRLR